MPTGRWWSSVAWEGFSFPMYPHPLAVRATPDGLGVDLPPVTVGTDEQFSSHAILAEYDGALTIGAAEGSFEASLVDGYSDWGVRIALERGDGRMTFDIAHGSPYIYVRTGELVPQLTFATPPQQDGDTLTVSLGSRHFAAFAPTNSLWTVNGAAATLTDGAYFSVAGLPDGEPETVALFRQAAHLHVVGTRVDWTYDRARGSVRARYLLEVDPLERSTNLPLVTLYPHQRRSFAGPVPSTGKRYACVRGELELVRAASFETEVPLPGLLPTIPRLGNETDELRALVDAVAAEGDHHLAALWPHAERDMYWTGVSLNRITMLVPIAERVGADAAVTEFVAWLKRTLEQHFMPVDETGAAKTTQVYWYDDLWRTVIGYPGGFGANTALNDHHYQYAYWVRAAVEIARHDPQWIRPEAWGGMVDTLVRDVVTVARDDEEFPFVRHFDVYAGHSWATGRQEFSSGANAESSSEAIAMWSAALLWAETIGDRSLADAAAWLYATEVHAAEEYWFDVHAENFPPAFERAMLGQVWGGKGTYSTWWTDDPEPMRGISFIPFTPASFYLGRDPRYIRRNLADLRTLREQWTYWPDVLWCYEALVDPECALALRAANPDHAEGHSESRPHTLSWLLDLQTLGRVDSSVTADSPFAIAFVRDGARTYLATTLDPKRATVRFSDGTCIAVEPGVVSKSFSSL